MTFDQIAQAKSAVTGYNPYGGCEFVQTIEILPEVERLQLSDLVYSHTALLGQTQNSVRMNDSYRFDRQAQNIEIARRIGLSYRVPFFTTA